jgi:DNA-binding transcriptional LysR family regulator
MNMKYYNLLDIKLQEIYIFTLVAEYQSITKAAAYLYLTPSKVSKVIKKLEQLWGIQLFIRKKNTIQLTPAGKHAYTNLRSIIQNIESVLDETFNIQQVKPFIRIGCPTLCDPNELIVPIIQKFLKIYPHASVNIECEDVLSNLRAHLLEDRLDIIFTADYEIHENASDLEWKFAFEEPLYIIMNENHPLASEDEISLTDVEFEKFVLLNPTASMSTEYIIRFCKSSGFTPKLAHYTPNIYSQLMSVHIDQTVICLQSIRGLKNTNGLCCRKLKDFHYNMGFAYRKDAPKLIQDFSACAAASL